MSDLGERADDLERRMAAAGSTEAIIGGLVKGAARNRRAIWIMAVSLILDVVLSLAMAGLAYNALHQSERVEANTNRLCLSTQKFEQAHNSLVDTLIINVKTSSPKIFTPDDKARRIKNYEDSRVPVEICAKR